FCFFFFQAEDGIRDLIVTGVQTCALPICAVGADDRDELPLAHGEAHAVERREVAVALRQAPRVEQDAHVPARWRRARSPVRPWGKESNTTARIAPKTKRQYWVIDITWSWNRMKTKEPRTGAMKFQQPP